jgi:protein tyrosine phosphatase (PTP) superfamily phosphohydrolase (DUF442 family)
MGHMVRSTALMLLGVSLARASYADQTRIAPAGAMPVRFAQVDERLYRGGQPTDAQLQELKALGVKTIISLRREDRDVTAAEEREAHRLGLKFLHFPFYGIFGASTPFLEQILAELRAPKNGVVYIHCKRGRDRTSLLVALHLVIDGGWAPRDAWQHAAIDFGYQSTFWYRAIGATFDRMVRAHGRGDAPTTGDARNATSFARYRLSSLTAVHTKGQ